jgi:hypothetical protein
MLRPAAAWYIAEDRQADWLKLLKTPSLSFLKNMQFQFDNFVLFMLCDGCTVQGKCPSAHCVRNIFNMNKKA